MQNNNEEKQALSGILFVRLHPIQMSWYTCFCKLYLVRMNFDNGKANDNCTVLFTFLDTSKRVSVESEIKDAVQEVN
jgi:hypothetical protein